MAWRAKYDIEHLARPPSQTESDAATSTYRQVRQAVEAEGTFRNRSLDIFLQGSYGNSTNISGSSDVDVVSRLGDTFYHDFFSDVPDDAIRSIRGRHSSPATYDWAEYRRDLLAVLHNRFPSAVQDGSKAITVLGTPSRSRLDADVIPCVTFRMYRADGTYEEGICFWAKDGSDRIANFPKQHRENLSTKNAAWRAGPKFKGIVRAIKRLRDLADPSKQGAAKNAASYWIECLVYNVPDSYFKGQYNDILLSVLVYLYGALKEGGTDATGRFMQANSIYFLFHPRFWDTASAFRLIDAVWDEAYARAS